MKAGEEIRFKNHAISLLFLNPNEPDPVKFDASESELKLNR